MIKKKIYLGEPGGGVKVVSPSGRSHSLRHVVLLSPTGFGVSEAAATGALGQLARRLSTKCDGEG